MINIEKGVYFGRGPETAIIREMIATMEVNDSCVIESNNQSRFSSSLTRIPQRLKSTIKFKTEKIDENKFRVWRIK